MTAPTNAPAIDIDTLTSRKLDAAVAEQVMGYFIQGVPRDGVYPVIVDRYPAFLYYPDTDDAGWLYLTRNHDKRWFPSSSLEHAAEVEAEIERREMKGFYIMALIEATHHMISEDIDAWLIATATPQQRCRAALRAVMG